MKTLVRWPDDAFRSDSPTSLSQSKANLELVVDTWICPASSVVVDVVIVVVALLSLLLFFFLGGEFGLNSKSSSQFSVTGWGVESELQFKDMYGWRIYQ